MDGDDERRVVSWAPVLSKHGRDTASRSCGELYDDGPNSEAQQTPQARLIALVSPRAQRQRKGDTAARDATVRLPVCAHCGVVPRSTRAMWGQGGIVFLRCDSCNENPRHSGG